MELKESAEKMRAEEQIEKIPSESSIANRPAMSPETKQKIKILINKVNELSISLVHGKDNRDLYKKYRNDFSFLVMDFTDEISNIENNQHQAKKHLINAVYYCKKINRCIAKDNQDWIEFKKNWGGLKNQIIKECHIKINPFKVVAAQLVSAKIPSFFLIKTQPKKTGNTYFEHIDYPKSHSMNSPH